MKNISVTKDEEMNRKKEFISSVFRGLSDVEKGEVITTTKLRAELKKKRIVNRG
jgi:hypothetical protein